MVKKINNIIKISSDNLTSNNLEKSKTKNCTYYYFAQITNFNISDNISLIETLKKLKRYFRLSWLSC